MILDRKRLPLAVLAAGISLLSFAPALAQQAGYSQLDVRQPDAAADLSRSLARLGDNPRDVQALIGAGEAALALNDPRAATGFFARADEIESGNGRIKAGLGRAMLQLQNPAEALRLFDQATRLGQPDRAFLSDRALARDLTGDQAGAQRDYQAALRNAPDDAETIRRYAVSLGIAGQVDAAEKIAQPLLYKSDRAAWRNRAFIFAMNGRRDDARGITQKVMPKPLADAIQPYMDRMPQLNAAQRAAAVHFGNFPAAGTRLAAAQPTPAPTPPAANVAQPPAVLARNNASASRQRPDRRATRAAERNAPAATSAGTNGTPIGPATAQLAEARRVGEQVDQRADASPQQVPARTAAVDPARARIATAAPGPATLQGPPAPISARPPAPSAPQSANPSASQPGAAAPAAARPQPNPEATRTLADIIRELQVPESERQTSVAAVNLDEIAALQDRRRQEQQAAAEKAKRDAAARAKAEADKKAKAEAAEKARLAKNPSRNWVQVGTGQNISALGFTLRALRKKHAELASRDGYTAAWGRTNRLVVGPFPSFAKARDFEAELKKAGADAFAWQSQAGEEVARVGGK